jgi:hypothetical protein
MVRSAGCCQPQVESNSQMQLPKMEGFCIAAVEVCHAVPRPHAVHRFGVSNWRAGWPAVKQQAASLHVGSWWVAEEGRRCGAGLGLPAHSMSSRDRVLQVRCVRAQDQSIVSRRCWEPVAAGGREVMSKHDTPKGGVLLKLHKSGA